MEIPEQPVTLSPDQIKELCERLATLRHNVNNDLSLIVAATEVLRSRPDLTARFLTSFEGASQRIGEEVKRFSKELEHCLGIVRPG